MHNEHTTNVVGTIIGKEITYPNLFLGMKDFSKNG